MRLFSKALLEMLPLALAGVLALVTGPAEAQDDGGGSSKPATPVVVEPAREVEAAPRFTYHGFFEPVRVAHLSAVEPGYVKSIRKRAGERVEAGGVLAVLSNPDLKLNLSVVRAQIAESRAELERARMNLNRLRQLYDKELIPAERFENEQATARVVRARLETRQAQRNRLQERLKLLTVRAPFAGQVVQAELEQGQWVNPSQKLYEIANYEEFEVKVGVPGKYLSTIPAEAPVDVYASELDAHLEGRIHAVVRHVAQESGTFTVRIRVDNPDHLALSGLVGQATVPVAEKARVKVVPRDAIVRRAQGPQIAVVRGGKAEVIPVTVRGNLKEGVIVEAESLQDEEPVVVRGNERLFPGTPVKVRQPSENGAQ